MHVLATAGHVDHGKSSLVLALTGTDPDRWKQEKERGLTIDLGFAHAILPSGREVSLVDVPGHIRFIKNMLAGVGAIDGVIFVVAATEGWKPQSEEHLRILDLLGCNGGVVALTKSDLVDEEWLELARMEVSDHLQHTFLESAPIIPVDSHSGNGLDMVVSQIDSILENLPTSPDRERPRLWIDRVFSAKGSGTVVTGTLSGGTLSVDQELIIFGSSGRSWNVSTGERGLRFAPDIEDLSTRTKVRSLQSHGQKLEKAAPGRRLAVNLLGVHPEELARGDVLLAPRQWCATATFDGFIKVLGNLDHDVSRKGAYALYIGSGDYQAKIAILGSHKLEPGAQGHVRVHLNSLVPVTMGDRFILRELGRQETVAGGSVVDVQPRSAKSEFIRSASAESVIEDRGVIDSQLLYKMTGTHVEPNLGNGLVISEPLRNKVTADLLEKVSEAGSLGLELSALDWLSHAVLATVDRLVTDGSRVYAGDERHLDKSLANHEFVKALESNLFSPPAPQEVDRAELRELVKRSLVIEQDGIYFSPKALDRARSVIWEMCNSDPAGFTVSQLREQLGTSRKYLLALVAYLDAKGFTRRSGDFRKPGPALEREFGTPRP